MADLLECVIQIKALAESIARLRHLVGAVAATNDPRFEALLAQLVDAERSVARVWQAVRFSAALRGHRSAENHFGSDFPGTVSAIDEFIALRLANLDVLQACTAADLASPVTWPGRCHTTVADLVAIVLASDTEVLGELRLLPVRKSLTE